MKSTQSAALAASKTGDINQVWSGQSLHAPVHMMTETVLMEAADAVNGTVDFCPALHDCYLSPELSRLRCQGSAANAINVTFKLAKVNAANVVTDLAVGANCTGSAGVVAAPGTFTPTGGPMTLGKGERLRLILTGVTSAGAGRVIQAEILTFIRSAPGMSPA